MSGVNMEFFNALSRAIEDTFPEEYKKLIFNNYALNIMIQLEEYILDKKNHQSAEAENTELEG